MAVAMMPHKPNTTARTVAIINPAFEELFVLIT
jgi:hypothetical protein